MLWIAASVNVLLAQACRADLVHVVLEHLRNSYQRLPTRSINFGKLATHGVEVYSVG